MPSSRSPHLQSPSPPETPANLLKLQMLFTWDTKNLCIIFRWWHVRSTAGLIISLLAVVAITALYEALRSASRRYEAFVTKTQVELPSELPSSHSSPSKYPFPNTNAIPSNPHIPYLSHVPAFKVLLYKLYWSMKTS